MRERRKIHEVLVRSRSRCEGKINMYLKEIQKGVEWIHLNQNTDQWKAFVNAFSISLRVALTLRRLMSYIYIYGAPILDVSRSHKTTQHSR